MSDVRQSDDSPASEDREERWPRVLGLLDVPAVSRHPCLRIVYSTIVNIFERLVPLAITIRGLGIYRMSDAIEYAAVLGVDPGLSGGIACWKKGATMQAFAMPPTEGDLVELIRSLVVPGETIAYVEEVTGYIGKKQPGGAMFRFGQNFGFILGTLQSLRVRVELVRPQKWQRDLGMGTASSCASRTIWKNKLKSRAQQLHSGTKVTLSSADAILIMEHGLKSLRMGSRGK